MQIFSGQRRIQISQMGGTPTPKGVLTYYLAEFRQKLHENEENWTERGGSRPKFYYVDPPLVADSGFHMFQKGLIFRKKSLEIT